MNSWEDTKNPNPIPERWMPKSGRTKALRKSGSRAGEQGREGEGSARPALRRRTPGLKPNAPRDAPGDGRARSASKKQEVTDGLSDEGCSAWGKKKEREGEGPPNWEEAHVQQRGGLGDRQSSELCAGPRGAWETAAQRGGCDPFGTGSVGGAYSSILDDQTPGSPPERSPVLGDLRCLPNLAAGSFVGKVMLWDPTVQALEPREAFGLLLIVLAELPASFCSEESALHSPRSSLGPLVAARGHFWN